MSPSSFGGTEGDSEALRHLVDLWVHRPQESFVLVGTCEQVCVDITEPSATQTKLPTESDDLGMALRGRTLEKLQIAKELLTLRHAHAQVQLDKHQGVNLHDPLPQEIHQAPDGRIVAGERQPDISVDADQTRTRRRRTFPAGGFAENPSAKRSDASCRKRVLRASSTTPDCVVISRSPLKNRRSFTAFITWSRRPSSSFKEVRTSKTISPAPRQCGAVPGTFFEPRPIYPTGRNTRA